MDDKIAEKVNDIKEKFINKHGEKAYQEIEEKYVEGEIDKFLSYEGASDLIEELREKM